ncbi:MAG: hypothetical protein ABFD49_10235 [Armatimonadota bacterium]|nr:hypothetical protein [bacterium]
MRAASWLIALVWVIVPAACAFAEDTPWPPLPVVSIEPGFEYPSPFPQLTPPPPIVGMPSQVVPSPIAPSETPSGYIAPCEQELVFQAPPGNFVNVQHADHSRTTFDEEGRPALTIAHGHITILYHEYVVNADDGTVDYQTGIATFCGNVVFNTGNQKVLGDQASLNLRTGRWVVHTAASTINPKYTNGNLKAPVFANAPLIDGVKRQSMFLNSSEVTTCNLEHRHYELVSKSVSIYPGRRIILRDASFYALGKRIITFRRLVFPLREVMNNTQLIPKIGQTNEEGIFAKFAYPLWAGAAQSGIFLLDLMSKKGVGTGLKNNYTIGNGTGTLQAYTLSDQNTNLRTNTGTLEHMQTFGNVKFGLSSSLRSNSYLYASDSLTFKNKATFTHSTDTTDSSLVFGYNENKTTSSTATTTGTLKQTLHLGKDAVLEGLFDYLAYSGSTNRARLSSNLSFTKKEDKFDWSITAAKLTDLSDEAFVSSGKFSGIEKLPELALTSDSAKLGKTLPFGIPLKLRFAYGHYNELTSTTNLMRTYLELNTPVQTHCVTNTWQLQSGGGFRQYAYSDETAQYTFDASAQLKKQLTTESNFALTYRYQNPRGYSPFRFDSLSDYNIINASLNLKSGAKNSFSLIGGYNFIQHSAPWQSTTVRWSVQASKNLLFYTATGYNFNTSKWKALINQVRIRSDNDSFKLDLGTRYDTTENQLSSIKGVIDTKLGSKYHFQANAGYDGLNNEFDYLNFKLTRDLHCWEASLVYTDQTGFYEDKGLRLYLRIKAFPFFDDFGTGTFGQALDTSVGEVY